MTNQLAEPAARADRGQPAARRPPPLHRDGAGRRVGRRHRARPRAAASTCPTGSRLGLLGGRPRPVDRRGPRRGRAGDGRPAGGGRRCAPTGWRGPGAVAGNGSTRTLLVRIAAEHDDGDDQRLRRDLRRHHRAAVGAAQGRLGRRRAPHRARDQEPADPDPAFGRTAAPQIPEGDQGRSGDLPHLHRHDRPPGRAISAGWSTSSPPSPGCRRRC